MTAFARHIGRESRSTVHGDRSSESQVPSPWTANGRQHLDIIGRMVLPIEWKVRRHQVRSVVDPSAYGFDGAVAAAEALERPLR